MILVIPTIFLREGKSVYSIGGMPEFNKLEDYFKSNPLELAKLFREENNKSILFDIDDNYESIQIVSETIKTLDIPIQINLSTRLSDKNMVQLLNLNITRIFDLSCKNSIDDVKFIPHFKLSEFDNINLTSYQRIILDFEQEKLLPIALENNVKISVINLECDTNDLVNLNKSKTNIDSVYLGKDYYEVKFAGQKLWRIAEKAQFGI